MLTLLGSLSIFFINLSDGENIVYEKIISRLEFENGEMKGNNRFSSTFESNYQEYLKTDKKYLGIGKEMASLDYDWSIGSAGWKKLILKKGLIGSILILSFYILLLIDKWSKAGFAFFIIFLSHIWSVIIRYGNIGYTYTSYPCLYFNLIKAL